MSKLLVIFSVILLYSCTQQPKAINVLGTTIKFPINSIEAKKNLHLNLRTQGRYFSIDNKTCKTISICFPDSRYHNRDQSIIWGHNISVDSNQTTLLEVLSVIEKENDIKFKLDTSVQHNPYYKAYKDGIKYAVRSTGNGAIPNLKRLSSSFQHCFPKWKKNRISIYVTDQLSDKQFYYYVISDGTIVDGD